MCRTVVVGRLRRAGAAPFAVKNAVIVDQDGRKVKLWGVNDLAPFNHNFVNIRQAGVDLKTAIDTDIAHFKLMNIDFIAGFGAVKRRNNA